MRFLALSGSNRQASTNTALLRALGRTGPPNHTVTIYDGLGELPIFSPDREGALPPLILRFAKAVANADGLIVASPEYVRSIPGGLKNAIDWLVSRDEMINKPIGLVHASHRGDDMLQQLRIVLGTVSGRFNASLFLRFPLMKMSPAEMEAVLRQDQAQADMRAYLDAFASFCARPEG